MTRSLACLTVLVIAAGCATTDEPKLTPKSTNSALVQPPAQNVFLRASFDDNPRSFIGRFIPDGLARADIDENRAATTRCSEFLTFEEVNASGSTDTTFNSSTSVNANLGVVPIASAELSKSSEHVLRVKYTLRKKLRALVKDPAALDRCCKAASDQCAKQYIGEFWYGSGSVFQVLGDKTSVEASGMAKNVSGAVDYKDDVAWKQLTEFTDVYFAFRTNETGLGSGVAAMGADDCTWAKVVPTSLDGQYFVGLSTPTQDPAIARDDAMRNARTQAVKYLGEFLKTSSSTTSSAVQGILSDERVVSAVAEGVAERVKDQRWCDPETIDSPKGRLYVSKVLAFFPNQDKVATAKASVEAMKAALQAKGKLTPKLEKELTSLSGDLK